MKKHFCFATAILWLALLYVIPANAGGKLALIIGNAEYKGLGKGNDLVNTTNDAKSMAELLKSLGFRVFLSLNADKNEMERALQSFSFDTIGADLSLFFFAGHGMQISGANYLLPSDVKIDRSGPLSEQLVSFNLVKSRSTFGVKRSIIILDACRNNPLSVEFTADQARKSAELGIGLAPIAEQDIQIGMATQPGSVAEDGEAQDNSPYTTALLHRLRDKSLSISSAFDYAKQDVVAATEGRQTPWNSDAPFAATRKLTDSEPDEAEGKIATKFGISDKLVANLRRLIWATMPPTIPGANGALIRVEPNNPEYIKKHDLSVQFMRDIILAANTVSLAQKCGLNAKQFEMFVALLKNAEKAGLTTPDSLHLAKHINIFIIQLLNGEVSVQRTSNGKTTKKKLKMTKIECSEERKQYVLNKINRYIEVSNK